MKTFKKLAAKATKRHDEHPHSSQSTAPSHNHDKFSDKALTVLIFSAEAAGRILDDLEVPVLKTAVGGLLAVLKSIKATKSNEKILEQLGDRVDELRRTILEPVYKSKNMILPPSLEEDILEFSERLKKLMDDWNNYPSRSFAKRAVNADCDQDKLKMLSGGIQNAVTAFSSKGIVAVRLETANKNYADLVDRLPRVTNAMHGFNSVDNISTCFKDTRTNVLGMITRWINSDDGKCVFWLNGMAGIGKTTIARTVVEQDEDIWVASFFFSRDDDQASGSLVVFPTLAYQLARKHPRIVHALAEMIKDNRDCAAYPLNKQFSAFIADPLKALGDTRHTVLLVLDALDECASKEDTSTILQLLLAHAPSIPCNLRILVTSRPENHIQSIFDKEQNHAKIILHDIEKAVVNDDIERFVRHELVGIFDRMGLPRPDDRDVKRLAEKSDNLFIFAATALRYICDDTAGDPKRRLEVILGDTEGYRSKPYSAVDRLYWTIVDKAVPADHDSLEEMEDRFQRVVGTIVTLRDPLPLSALRSIVRSERDVDSTLRLLRSVIRVPSSSSEAPRVLHPSFVDFLTNSDRCTDRRLLIDVSVQEIFLARHCLEVMMRCLKRNMAGIEDETMANMEVTDLGERVNKAFPSELRYACLYWASHMIAIEGRDAKCLSLLSEFTRERLLNWIEAMCLLEEVPRGIIMMRDMHMWATKMQVDGEVAELLYDSYRCLLQYHDGFEDSALHVYHSALQFLPRDSALYRAYEGTDRNSVRVVRGAPRKWTPRLSEISFTRRRRGAWNEDVSVALSPDGRHFATGADECDIALWDVHTGTHIITFERAVHICSLEFFPNGQLASGNGIGEISLWDVVTGSRVRTVQAHGSKIISLSASHSRLASGSWDRTVRVWDTTSWQCISTLECVSAVASVALYQLYPNGDRVACELYDTVRMIMGHVAVSNNGKWLAVAREDTIALYDVTTFDCIWSIDCESGFISFSPNDSRLVSASDGQIKLFDVQNGDYIKSFDHSFVARAVFSRDGTRLISASNNGTCQLWDHRLSDDEQRQIDRITCTAFSKDGSLLAVTLGENLELWKVSTWERSWSISHEVALLNDICFSPDGLQVFAKIDYNHFRVYDVRSGESMGDETGSMRRPMHDHVHWAKGAVWRQWQCIVCESSLLSNGEYWFIESDRWVWIVQGHVARRLVQIPDEYHIIDIRSCQGCVAVECKGRLLVLDTSRVISEVVSASTTRSVSDVSET